MHLSASQQHLWSEVRGAGRSGVGLLLTSCRGRWHWLLAGSGPLISLPAAKVTFAEYISPSPTPAQIPPGPLHCFWIKSKLPHQQWGPVQQGLHLTRQSHPFQRPCDLVILQLSESRVPDAYMPWLMLFPLPGLPFLVCLLGKSCSSL